MRQAPPRAVRSRERLCNQCQGCEGDDPKVWRVVVCCLTCGFLDCCLTKRHPSALRRVVLTSVFRSGTRRCPSGNLLLACGRGYRDTSRPNCIRHLFLLKRGPPYHINHGHVLQVDPPQLMHALLFGCIITEHRLDSSCLLTLVEHRAALEARRCMH